MSDVAKRAYGKVLQNYLNAFDMLMQTDAKLEIANERIAALEKENEELKNKGQSKGKLKQEK